MHLESDSSTPDRDRIRTPPLELERWRAFEAARQRWPGVTLGFEDFSARLAHLGYDRALPLHPGALYLCSACSFGDERACRVLEDDYLVALGAYVARFDPRPDAIADILQRIRCHLLVGPNPRIRSYRGQGPFERWLREVARSTAIDHLRRRRADDLCVSRLNVDQASRERTHAPQPSSPEEQAFFNRHIRAIEGALVQAIQALPSDRRQLLHHYYVSGFSIDQLGELYDCDRSTAARRIGRSLATIQRSLCQALRLRRTSELAAWMPALNDGCGLDLVKVLEGCSRTSPTGAAGDSAL